MLLSKPVKGPTYWSIYLYLVLFVLWKFSFFSLVHLVRSCIELFFTSLFILIILCYFIFYRKVPGVNTQREYTQVIHSGHLFGWPNRLPETKQTVRKNKSSLHQTVTFFARTDTKSVDKHIYTRGNQVRARTTHTCKYTHKQQTNKNNNITI